jgi:hypothetical protein
MKLTILMMMMTNKFWEDLKYLIYFDLQREASTNRPNRLKIIQFSVSTIAYTLGYDSVVK